MSLRPRALTLAWIAVIGAGLWMIACTPVVSQEAYYWTYALHPALSYFDHPPMAAWLMALSTGLFGDGAFGLRFATLACGLGTTWVGGRLLRDLGGSPRASVAWVLASLAVPALAVGHFLANPDAPLLFFWTTTLYALWRARTTARVRWWLLAGACAGCALLSKYSAAFLAPGGIVLLLCDRDARAQLARPGPWLALITAATFFLPVVVWNALHGWVSFGFQSVHRYEIVSLRPDWVLRFVGGQLLLLSPPVVLRLAKVARWLRSGPGTRGTSVFLVAFSAPLPLFMLANSLILPVKLNWVLPAYVTLTLAAILELDSAGLLERASRGRRWLVRWAVFALVLCLSLPLIDWIPQRRGSSWSGWSEIASTARAWAARVDAEDGIDGNVFLFGLDYKDSAQLMYGLTRTRGPNERARRVLAQNVVGGDALQFGYWIDPRRLVGQDAILVLTRPRRRSNQVPRAERCFASVERVEHVSIDRLGRTVLEADILRCTRYAGPPPGGESKRGPASAGSGGAVER